MSYNDRGPAGRSRSTEGAEAILSLLGDDWRWPIDDGELDPEDPIVNTATEYMVQMATIAHHTLTGAQNVVLPAVVYWDGNARRRPGSPWSRSSTPAASGTRLRSASLRCSTLAPIRSPSNGRYWTGFNRTHPLDGPARELAWNGTVHGLFAELGVGATTATSPAVGAGYRGRDCAHGPRLRRHRRRSALGGHGRRKEDEPVAA